MTIDVPPPSSFFPVMRNITDFPTRNGGVLFKTDAFGNRAAEGDQVDASLEHDAPVIEAADGDENTLGLWFKAPDMTVAGPLSTLIAQADGNNNDGFQLLMPSGAADHGRVGIDAFSQKTPSVNAVSSLTTDRFDDNVFHHLITRMDGPNNLMKFVIDGINITDYASDSTLFGSGYSGVGGSSELTVLATATGIDPGYLGLLVGRIKIWKSDLLTVTEAQQEHLNELEEMKIFLSRQIILLGGGTRRSN